jgi:hypothetical protein
MFFDFNTFLLRYVRCFFLVFLSSIICFFGAIRFAEADQKNILKGKELIINFKSVHGFAPTESDYYSILLDKENEFTNSEAALLWFLLLKQQFPSIQMNSLQAIFKAKMESIRDFKSEFEVVILGDEDAKINDVFNYLYTYKSDKFLVDFERKNNKKSRNINSFDGNCMIYITGFDMPGPTAVIDRLDSRTKSFVPYMPLCQMMLFDTTTSGIPNQNYDFSLVKNLYVFEKEEMFNNHRCLVLANENCRILLDIDKDYSVVKRERYELITKDFNDGFRIVERILTTIDILSEFKDCGNGIWVAQKIENKEFDKLGKVIVRNSMTKVKNVEINSGIQDSYFIDVISENTFVLDNIRGITYMQSDHPSIDSLLEKTVKSKRVLIYRYISVITGLILIFIALALKYRVYLKDKRERENKTEEETK